MIPKIIHLCWLSRDPYPPLIVKCLESWRQKLPDYIIKLWDTDAIDINSNIWLKQSFSIKKYAFAADYIRFYALYNYGGIYLDADVEVLKSFDTLLNHEYFLGEEASGDIEAAVMGAEKGLKWVKECLDYYNNRPFIKEDGNYDMRPLPLLINTKIQKYNLSVMPYYYFSPKDYNIGKIDINEETYCIHHFDGKWIKNGITPNIKKSIHKIIYAFLGRKYHNKLIHFIRPYINH